MDWLAWLIGACCLLASVALPIAISERSSSQATAPRTRIVCARSPDWFRAIHRSYGCNPKITPQFDFTALYAPASAIEVGGTDTGYAQRCGDAARRDRGPGGGALPLRARTSIRQTELILARTHVSGCARVPPPPPIAIEARGLLSGGS